MRILQQKTPVIRSLTSLRVTLLTEGGSPFEGSRPLGIHVQELWGPIRTAAYYVHCMVLKIALSVQCLTTNKFAFRASLATTLHNSADHKVRKAVRQPSASPFWLGIHDGARVLQGVGCCFLRSTRGGLSVYLGECGNL